MLATDQISEHAGDTVAAERLNESDQWVCTVTPSDGSVEGPLASATATVAVGYVGWSEQSIQLSDADYTSVCPVESRYKWDAQSPGRYS